MRTAHEICFDLGVKLHDYREGNRKIACPKCGPTRKHKLDKSLSVTIDAEGVKFKCHNCDWHGGEFYAKRTFKSGDGVVRGPGAGRGDRDALRRLHDAARRG